MVCSIKYNGSITSPKPKQVISARGLRIEAVVLWTPWAFLVEVFAKLGTCKRQKCIHNSRGRLGLSSQLDICGYHIVNRNGLACQLAAEEALAEIFWSIGNNNAPGLDVVSDWFISVFGASIVEGYFSARWKRQKLVLLPKSNKQPGHPSWYRPIRFIDTISLKIGMAYRSNSLAFVKPIQKSTWFWSWLDDALFSCKCCAWI